MSSARFLVVASDADDARLVAEMLQEDLEHVATVHDEDQAIRAFEAARPNVLVLAYRTLADAERFYLGLLRRSGLAYAVPHRTVLLCRRAEAFQAYELCRKQHFDDYVVFWPGHYDPHRLRMAALLASRAAAVGPEGPTASEFALQARRLADVEGMLQARLARGTEHIDAMLQTVVQTEASMRRALDGISDKQQAEALRQSMLGKPWELLYHNVRPLQDWVGEFANEVADGLAPIRELGRMAGQVVPIVMVVEDDRFQHQLLARMLAEEDIRLVFAGSGAEALSLLRSMRPDLVMMDLNLPDMDGIEVMRRLRAVPATAGIPTIMITGTSTREVLERSKQAGAVDFMVKPFDKVRLKAGLAQYLPK